MHLHHFIFLCIFLFQSATQLQKVVQGFGTTTSTQLHNYHLSMNDISNVLLLRLFSLTSEPNPMASNDESKSIGCHDAVQPTTCYLALTTCHQGHCTHKNTAKQTLSSDDLVQHNGSQTSRNRGKYLLPKRLFDKIKKKRNTLAHGGEVMIPEVLNLFQKVERFIYSSSGSSRMDQELHLCLRQSFDDSVSILKSAMINSVDTAANVVLHTASITTSETQRRLFSSVPPKLIGREGILKQLAIAMAHSTLGDSKSSNLTLPWPRLLLHGEPGIGKTAVVRELSRRLEKSHPHQGSFQATNEATLTADIRLFLKMEMQEKTDHASPAFLCSAFKDYLHQTTKSFLLVFEDVGDPCLVTPLISESNHSIIFTSPNNLSWRENGFIPGEVTGIRLDRLGEEDSMLLLAQTLIDNGCKQLWDSISRTSAEIEHLRSFLSKDMAGLPLAVRLVAFQLCQDNSMSTLLSKVIKEASSEQRSIADEKAAGRVHVRGFYHVVRYAVLGMSNDKYKLIVCFALSILKLSWPSSLFLELVLERLNYTSDQIHGCLQALMKTGLVTKFEEEYCMHQVVQSHIRAIITSLFKEVRDVVVNALLCAFNNTTILSTRVPLHKSTNQFVGMSVQSCISFQHRAYREYQCNELVIGGAITDFLDQAESIKLTWKERIACRSCLLWCYEHSFTCLDLLSSVVDKERDDFTRFQGEIEACDIAFEDDDTVRSILFSRWTFGCCSLAQVCSDISKQVCGKQSDDAKLVALLCCGGKALVTTKQHASTEDLFMRFGLTVNDLVSKFETERNEIFCSAALVITLAFGKCKQFIKARTFIFDIIRVWLPMSKAFSIDCHEEIIRTIIRVCTDLWIEAKHDQVLEMYSVAYTVCLIDGYSCNRPDLALFICHLASHSFAQGCQFDPKTISVQGNVWLHRALFLVEIKPQQNTAALECLLGTYVQIVNASTCTFGRRVLDETSLLAEHAGARLLPAFACLLKGQSSISVLCLDNVIAVLILVSAKVASVSNLDTESVVLHCQKLARCVSPVPVSAEALHSEILLLPEFDKCLLQVLATILLQYTVNHDQKVQTYQLDLFSRTEDCSESRDDKPDPAVIKTTIDIFTKELMLCGKRFHAKVVQEAFRLWPSERRKET